MGHLAEQFKTELETIYESIRGVSPALADVPWRAGGWTRKQIVGHLLDSATNNRQRFVRASTEGVYVGPSYAQDAWVAAHGYTEQPWVTLLEWWRVEHSILAAVVAGIAEGQLGVLCTLGDDAPVTLLFLVEDYVRHQKWHLKQLQAPLT